MGTSKQHMKIRQPRNYDFRVSQFNIPRSQSGNDHEMTDDFSTWPSLRLANCTHNDRQLEQLRANSVKWRLLQNLATTAKWQARSSTIAAKICMRFCIALQLLSAQVPLGSFWQKILRVGSIEATIQKALKPSKAGNREADLERVVLACRTGNIEANAVYRGRSYKRIVQEVMIITNEVNIQKVVVSRQYGDYAC